MPLQTLEEKVVFEGEDVVRLVLLERAGKISMYIQHCT